MAEAADGEAQADEQDQRGGQVGGDEAPSSGRRAGCGSPGSMLEAIAHLHQQDACGGQVAIAAGAFAISVFNSASANVPDPVPPAP